MYVLPRITGVGCAWWQLLDSEHILRYLNDFSLHCLSLGIKRSCEKVDKRDVEPAQAESGYERANGIKFWQTKAKLHDYVQGFLLGKSFTIEFPDQIFYNRTKYRKYPI